MGSEMCIRDRHEAFVSAAEIPIADIGFDLTPMVEKGFSVGELARGWMVLLYTVLNTAERFYAGIPVLLYCLLLSCCICRFSRFYSLVE